jgi:hypothetical protein
VAGINAGLSAQGREPFVRDRTESLIGKCYCWKRTRAAVSAATVDATSHPFFLLDCECRCHD